MANRLQPVIEEKKDALSRIRKFMSNEESGIVLTAVEELKLNRYILANSLLSEKRYTRDQIIDQLCNKFNISRYTARQDIDDTYGLFINVTDDYKKYTLFHHIEEIDQLIREWKNDPSLAPLIPKLLAEKTRAVVGMPVSQQQGNVPAPVIYMNVTNNLSAPMVYEEAMAEADKLIEYEKNHEYVDFEEKNEPE